MPPRDTPADDADAQQRDTIVAVLANRRRELGMSQVELARRMGIAQAQVSDIETRVTRDPRISTLQRYARAVGMVLKVDTGAPGSLAAHDHHRDRPGRDL